MGCCGLRLLKSAQNMPANSNNPSAPITIPIIAPVLKLEDDVEREVPLPDGEDAGLERFGELPLYVAVRG